MALRMPDAPQRYPLTLKAASLQSWSPTEAITTGATLSILRERSESAAGAAGGRGGGGGAWWRRRVGEEGEQKRVITQTTVFTRFTPSGSVSQGEKRAAWASTLALAASQSAQADFGNNSSPLFLHPAVRCEPVCLSLRISWREAGAWRRHQRGKKKKKKRLPEFEFTASLWPLCITV